MPYVIFRNMGPHFDSYANSGIPEIIDPCIDLHLREREIHRRESEQRSPLLSLLPHLQLIDVGTAMEHRLGDLQTLTKPYGPKREKGPSPSPTTPPLTDRPK